MRLVLFPNTPDQQIVEFFGAAATLGRAESNTILLSGKKIADYHARINFEDGEWIITDIAGQNDIILDGEKTTRGTLSVGSRVMIGDAALLVMSVEMQGSEVITVPAALAGGERSLVSRPPRKSPHRLSA